MRFHSDLPRSNDLGLGHINKYWSYVARFGLGSHGVTQKLFDRVRGRVSELFNAAIAC
jgi:hypothetical protein